MLGAAFTPSQFLMLAGPAIALLFAITFAALWVFHERSRYLLIVAAAFLCFAFAVLSQTTLVPRDLGHNTIVSAALYISSVLLFAEGVLRRIDRQLNDGLKVALTVGLIAMLWYFYYVSNQLVARIYVLNFGCGLILLSAVPKLRPLLASKLIDRVLYVMYVIFGISFFIRTSWTLTKPLGSNIAEFARSSFWLVLQLSMVLWTVALAIVLLLAVMSDRIALLRRERDMDPLTGLLNRRGFEESAATTLSTRSAAPACILVCDIDFFKQVNDRYGHAAGDAVLMEFGAILRHTLRTSDIAGRIGGEEFAIVLPATAYPDALKIAERLRLTLMNRAFDALPKSAEVTASFGLAQLMPGESLQSAMRRADASLYGAKDGGRNQIRTDRSVAA